ncbi:MAG TPA: carboxy terminal-processing peptidase [Gammaproteobacteria bacterium]|nr:carboxy terminal-processing peptidase [Gammaproteobacteria bacterium]
MTFSNARKFYKALPVGLLLCASGTVLAATAAPSAGSQLQPEPRQVLIARTVTQVSQQHHYPAEKLDAAFSSELLKEYIDTLDPGHFYFTQKDVDSIHKKYDKALGTDLKNGNLEPAFDIYKLYDERVRQRIHYALHLIKKKPSFTGSDKYRFARRHAPWAADGKALDKLWQERVKNDALVILLTGKSWKDAAPTLRKRYSRALKNLKQTTSDDVFTSFLNAYTQTLDPHSTYFSPFQSQQFQIEMSLHFEGIGAQLSETNGYATIVRLLPGGPAAKNGVLKSGDRITAVGQGKDGKMIDIVGWRLDDVVKKIRGPKGSTVRLRILPAGALPGSPEKTLSLVRNTVELNAQRAHGHTVLVKHGNNVYKVGIIDIPSFYVKDFGGPNSSSDHLSTSVTTDVKRILERMKKNKVSGILLDLRNNGGGSLQQAAALTGLFIPAGPVVQVQYRNGHSQVLPTPGNEKAVWKGPLALMINRFSASATEIFSGALKDYHRALVLGSRTWGKGTVQNLIPLNDYLPGFKAGELKLTMAQFFRIDGASTQLRGVEPDIKIPSSIDDTMFGESAFPNALPWKKMQSANYKTLNDSIDKDVPLIEKYLKDTVQKKPEYQIFEREINARKAMSKRKYVTLNLAKRKAERNTDRARELDFDNEWRKLNGEPPFKDLKAADDQQFTAPDTALDVATELLGEYIAIESDKNSPFKSMIKAIPAESLTLCVHGSSTGSASIRCRQGNKHKAETGVYYPPAPATAKGT